MRLNLHYLLLIGYPARPVQVSQVRRQSLGELLNRQKFDRHAANLKAIDAPGFQGLRQLLVLLVAQLRQDLFID